MSDNLSEAKRIIIIGAGFSSLSAACYLAKAGYNVQILEKNSSVGGRARQLKKEGFVFDIGPTFYWMPDVFESFFNDFNTNVSDFYKLEKLNPAYQVYFENGKSINIADNFSAIIETFEKEQPGSGKKLQEFIKKAEDNYNIAIKDLVYKPGEHLFEIMSFKTIKKLQSFFKSVSSEVRKHFKDENLVKILEFPVLFLGAKPGNTPLFYNFMNYADFQLGTWHPKGGMYSVVEGMLKLARSLGVNIIKNADVKGIGIEDDKVKAVSTQYGKFFCDILLSGADYQHTESLLPRSFRQYSESYWNKKTFAPSALLFYVGIDKKLKKVSHHTLFFDTDFEAHSKAIYDTGEWPSDPLFYASFPSITDKTAAPEGKEAGIFLIPIAPDSEDTEALRNRYFEILLDRYEALTGETLRGHIIFKESFCVNDFKKEYNSYKGNAYGLANTLFQTHVLRPKLKSKKVRNLYFAGQLTVPGPGVPPSLISGKIVSQLIQKYHS